MRSKRTGCPDTKTVPRVTLALLSALMLSVGAMDSMSLAMVQGMAVSLCRLGTTRSTSASTSSSPRDPRSRRPQGELRSLDRRDALCVTNFVSGRWNVLDYENNSIFENNDFGYRTDILVHAPEAAALSGREGGETRKTASAHRSTAAKT